jgi:phosphatidylserine decarboxylase
MGRWRAIRPPASNPVGRPRHRTQEIDFAKPALIHRWSTQYQQGKFLVASREECSRDNEQNIVTVTGDGATVIFKQIAGLIACRIVFTKKAGDHVAIGERIGLIKFGSRCDVLFGPEWEITVRSGQRVSAGSSVIARRLDRKSQ